MCSHCGSAARHTLSDWDSRVAPTEKQVSKESGLLTQKHGEPSDPTSHVRVGSCTCAENGHKAKKVRVHTQLRSWGTKLFRQRMSFCAPAPCLPNM